MMEHLKNLLVGSFELIKYSSPFITVIVLIALVLNGSLIAEGILLFLLASLITALLISAALSLGKEKRAEQAENQKRNIK